MKKIKILLIVLCSITLYFSSMFWIGSKEQLDQLIENSKFLFIINRVILNVIIIVFYSLILIMLKFIFYKNFTLKELKKLILNNFIILNIISAMLIILTHYNKITS